MLTRELDRPRRQSTTDIAGVHRGKAVAAEDHEAGAAAAVAGFAFARAAGPAAVIEVEFVADDQATTACGLHVAPVPVARFFRRAKERPPVGPVPVPAVPAEADADV